MWYHGDRADFAISNRISIGYASSADGVNWTKYADPVLEPGAAGTWESHSLGFPSVVYDPLAPLSERYRMWYAAFDWSVGPDGSMVGYATSGDAIHWSKYPGNPVVRPSPGEAAIFWPRVLLDPETLTFEMWYTWGPHLGLSMGYARSLDGLTWTKFPGPLAVAGEPRGTAGDFAVFFDKNLKVYQALYNRPQTDNSSTVGYANSSWTIPKASFTVSPETGNAPLSIAADAARSAAPTQEITKYAWDFGDGAKGEGVQVEHTYTEVGEYLLKLTVTDSAGAQGSIARKVLVSFLLGPVDPWTAQDIGAVSGAGGARQAGECQEVLGGAGAIGGKADSFHFVHQRATGNFCLTGHVSDWNTDVSSSNIGLMARAGLEPGAPEASILVQTAFGGRYRFLTRLVENNSTQTSSSVNGNILDAWLRLERKVDEFVASTSLDGAEWSELGRVTVVMPQEIDVGFAAADGRGPDGRDWAVARLCNLELATSCERRTSFHRGDPNSSGTTDISDGVTIFGYLFLGNPPALSCKESADTNNDAKIDISDGIAILQYLFGDGPPPATPGPADAPCGLDVDPPGSPGDLACERYPACE
jgi:hypothetical protein